MGPYKAIGSSTIIGSFSTSMIMGGRVVDSLVLNHRHVVYMIYVHNSQSWLTF